MLTRTFFNRSPFSGNQLAPLPAGSIRAAGEMKDRIISLRAGILSRLTSFVPEAGLESAFFGGKEPGSVNAGRYLESMLLTAAVLGDEELQREALSLSGKVLVSQREDGSFGAEDESFAARSAMLRALMCAYSLTGEKPYLTFVLRYFKYLQSTLHSIPLSREDALHIADTLDAGITVYNITGQKAILPVLDMLIQQGWDFTSLFHSFPYRIPISRQLMQENWTSDKDTDSYLEHLKQVGSGAVLAEGLRATAFAGIITGSNKHIHAAEAGLARINRYHGSITGSIAADPLLAGSDPSRGISAEASAELLASFEALFACPDGVQFADQWEKIFYNTILAAFSEDMHSVQSIQQANQISIQGGERFPFSKSDAALFSLRDREALCAILPALPRFLSHQWMLSRDDGLTAMGYAPCRVRYRLKDATLRLSVDSDYPRSGQIRITVNLDRDTAFPLRLRIPTWAEHASAMIEGETIDRRSGSFLVLSRQWHDGDVITLNLQMKPRLETGYHNSMSVHRGPVLYAMPLEGKVARRQDNEVESVHSSDFAYVMVEDAAVDIMEEDGRVRLTASAVAIDSWDETDGSCDPLPLDLPHIRREDASQLTLIPYAETTLRISAFPKISFSR